MNKTELEEKIKNGESVWAYDDLLHRVIPYKANEIAITGINTNMPAYELKDLFATKQQAEHYLHHANITRIEELPFLTWEEFLSEVGIGFISAEGFGCCLYYDKADDMIYLDKGYETDTYGATEADFYKAYDECVKLFKQE